MPDSVVGGAIGLRSGQAVRATGRGWVLAVIAACFGVLPLLVVRVTPLQDWPSHLARTQILAEMLAGPSPWARFYEVRSFLLPNVVLDAAVLGLMHVGLGIDAAGQVFLLLLYLVFVGGFLRLAAAFGAGGPLKLMLGALLFYQGSLFYGLVNYQFGLGLAMLFAGSFYRAAPLGRLGWAVLGTVVVFECHLVAAFVYVGIIGSFDLHRLWVSRGRSLLRSASVVAPGVTVALLLLSPTGHDGFGAVWDGDAGVAAFAVNKGGLFVKTLLGGAFESDVVCGVGMALLAAAVVVGCRVRVAAAAWVAAGVMGVVTVAAPGHLGAGSLLDYRIAVVPWLLLGAGLIIVPRAGWSRVLLLAMFGLVLARGAALAWSWRVADVQFAALEQALASLPRDSALLVGRGRVARDVPWREFWAFPYNTIPTYAVRYGVFVPSVYAHPAQQPLVLKPAFRYFNDFNDVSTPALLAALQRRDEVRQLCGFFAAGVRMVVIYPADAGLPGMARVGSRFGLLDMCGKG